MADANNQWGRLVCLLKLDVLIMPLNNINSVMEMNFTITTPMIRHLDLSYNQVSSVQNTEFASLPWLKHLNLGGNQLILLDRLLDLQYAVYINVSYNLINTLPAIFFQDFLNLEVLDAADNPFSCSCSIQPFQEWILSDTSIFLDSSQAYKCSTPKNLAGLSITQVKLDCTSKLPLYLGSGLTGTLFICLTVLVVIHYGTSNTSSFFSHTNAENATYGSMTRKQ